MIHVLRKLRGWAGDAVAGIELCDGDSSAVNIFAAINRKAVGRHADQMRGAAHGIKLSRDAGRQAVVMASVACGAGRGMAIATIDERSGGGDAGTDAVFIDELACLGCPSLMIVIVDSGRISNNCLHVVLFIHDSNLPVNACCLYLAAQRMNRSVVDVKLV